MADEARVTQTGVRNVGSADNPDIRVTQTGVRVLEQPPSLTRITQTGVRVLSQKNVPIRMTQVGVRYIWVTPPSSDSFIIMAGL